MGYGNFTEYRVAGAGFGFIPMFICIRQSWGYLDTIIGTQALTGGYIASTMNELDNEWHFLNIPLNHNI